VTDRDDYGKPEIIDLPVRPARMARVGSDEPVVRDEPISPHRPGQRAPIPAGPLIQCDGVVKIFKVADLEVVALQGLDLTVEPGEFIAIVGASGSGKSTLLSILGGQVFPSEGRVFVRDPVSPPPSALAMALGTTAKGGAELDPVLASRLLGMRAHLVKQHRNEIEELASPLRTSDGDPAPGARIRLAVATTVVLPTSVVLLEEPPGIDDPFMARIAERVHERLRNGSSLVLASRRSALVRELCDEAIVLDEGKISDRGGAKGVLRRYEAAGGGTKAAARAKDGQGSGGLAPSRYLSQGRKLRVPPVVPAFNASAALLAATLRTATGRLKRIDADADEVLVEIHLETALPDIEAHCGVVFMPRSGEGAGIRLEFPEPLRFVEPGTYLLTARTFPGALRSGSYEVRADAVVANPAERGASVIARHIGRVRIVSEEQDAAEPPGPAIRHWDGRPLWRAEAEWSIE
jgi:ABC-type polysaccharide/polyol phosphate transport system ATPase subunit